MKGHHDDQYLDVTTTFTNFCFSQVFLKQYLPYFELTNQIYDKDIAQVIGNMPDMLEICNCFNSLRSLRTKVFIDHLHKVTLTINREFLMALGNADCSQNLAKQTDAKLNKVHSYD